ncbi:lethal(2) giant larvae protein [Culicoides brevitarsis]|uniref:lethal(2) giant larvae protein n=1 Tax=Culicoides brevitarsis TaxID=469753 RepID=UPI00307B3027
MLKFIRGKGHQPTAERQKLQKELYAFRKTVQHGFPHKPSAIAYDPQRKLMAIGTQTGVLKVFGQPGVEFYGQHTPPQGGGVQDVLVQQIEWIPDSGRLITLTSANLLTLWEPAGTLMVPIKTIKFDGKQKKISSLCCSYVKDYLWVGTEGGNIFQLDIKTLDPLPEPVVCHDAVLDQAPKEYRHNNAGAIEQIKQLPSNFNHLLISYNRGLAILWDLEESKVHRAYVSPGHGQSVGLDVEHDGEKFTWYHADGSYATWDVDNTDPPEDQNYVPYGVDPCKAIDRLVRAFRGDDELVIFSGGMPRSAYGDHQCVSVHCKDGSKVALDFTSKVIDFFVTHDDDEPDQAQVLVVLLEEELVAYDLTDKTLPLVVPPYLHSLHASAVTCNHLVSDVTQEIFDKIRKAGEHQYENCSKIAWPVMGGTLPDREEDEENFHGYEILLTGHEDGSVKFWDCTKVNLTPLLQVKTAPIFGHGDPDFDQEPQESSEPMDEGEPPFRKAGQFDPYSDDPRLAVKKVAFCPNTGVLIVAGTAGNVVSFNFEVESKSAEPLKVTTMNLVSDRDGFIWKGHDQLKVRTNLLQEYTKVQEGLEVLSVLQVLPPAAITCVALQTKWNLVAAGTAHGLVLFDYQHDTPVFHKCTLNPNDLTGAGETLSRRKSFKKTLRESFRRLRKGRSTRNNPNAQAAAPAETRPMERQIEARPVDDGMGSMVRCLTFAHTYITNTQTPMASLWSGTNSSCVSVFVIYLPPKNDDPAAPRRPITGQLAKEIQLKHRAPVIGITLYDNAAVPLDFQQPGQTSAPHKVLIASEEQFKVFSLPQLKPVTKYKLTAHEGARSRKIQFASFTCKVTPELLQPSPVKQTGPHHVQSPLATNATPAPADANTSSDLNTSASQAVHTEIGLMCLTNLGECMVLSVPELKRQINSSAVRREDINGISSLCFTTHGEALYMCSSSELQRITLSATKIVSAEGSVDLEPLSEEQANSDEDEDTLEGDNEEKTVDEQSTVEVVTPVSAAANSVTNNKEKEIGYTNGIDTSPTKGHNDTIGDISTMTIDSVKDHLNSTVSTICSQTTEEIVGRLSVLSTNTTNALSVATSKEIMDMNMSNIKDLKEFGDTIETNSSSTVVKSVITSVTHTNGTNGDAETITTTTTTRKESQF